MTAHYGRDGGIGAHVIGSVRALREAGHEVKVAAATAGREVAGEPMELIPGVDGTSVTAGPARALELAAAEWRPDLVHLHDVADPAVAERLTAVAPVVWSVHKYLASTSGYKYFNPGQECLRPHGPGCIPNLLFRRCAKRRDPRPIPGNYRRATRMVRALRRVAATVACSRFVADHLRTNGVADPAVAWPFVERLPEPSPPPPEPRVLFAGRIDPAAKGLNVLLEAMTEVDAPLEVCGDGWWLDGARETAERLGISGRVDFRGWVDAQELERAYRRASVVAVPSLWPEPFGIVGIEAMAHGRPVVASDTGGVPEWHGGADMGALVPPGDANALARAVASLIGDPDRAAAIATAAPRRVAKRFTAESYLDALGPVYERALSVRASRPVQ